MAANSFDNWQSGLPGDFPGKTSTRNFDNWQSGKLGSVLAGQASQAATAAPDGVAAAFAVGSSTQAAGAVASPAGGASISAIGATTQAANAGTSPAGVSSASALGAATVTAGALTAPNGVASTSAIGAATADGGSSGDATAYPSGVYGTSATDAVIVSGDALVVVAGIASAFEIGSVTADGGTISAAAYPAGVSATASVGVVTNSSTIKTQFIRITPASLCYQSPFQQIPNGWAGKISLNTRAAFVATSGKTFADKLIQISLADANGNELSILQMPVTVRNRVSKSSASLSQDVIQSHDETDPVFMASEAAKFVSGDKSKLDSVYSWGNWNVAGLATRTWCGNTFFPLTGGMISGRVGIGNYPVACAALAVDSTTGGVLFPRMTQSDRDAIPQPQPGLLIWQTDNAEGFRYYTGSAWVSLASGSGSAGFYCAETGKTYPVTIKLEGSDPAKPYLDFGTPA